MKITVTVTVEADGQPPESWDIYQGDGIVATMRRPPMYGDAPRRLSRILRKSADYMNDQKRENEGETR